MNQNIDRSRCPACGSNQTIEVATEVDLPEAKISQYRECLACKREYTCEGQIKVQWTSSKAV